jgi:hypothetical protein
MVLPVDYMMKAMRRRIALQLRKLSRVQHFVRNHRNLSPFAQACVSPRRFSESVMRGRPSRGDGLKATVKGNT